MPGRIPWPDEAAAMLGSRPAALVHSRFDPGQGFPHLHVHHSGTELFVVVEGEVVFTVGDETVIKAAGEAVVVEPGTAHAFEAGPSGTRLAIVVSPPEFLEMIARLPKAMGRTAMAAVLADYDSALVD